MTPARHDRRRSFPVFLRALVTAAIALLAAGIAVFGVAGVPVAAPAGAEPAAPLAAQPTPGTDGVGAAAPAIGVVSVRQRQVIGWTAADGVVVTSDDAVAQVGVTATFRPIGGTEATCYVGHHVDRLRLAVLRCSGATGRPLGIATQFPAPGTPAVVPYLGARDAEGVPSSLGTVRGTLLDNNVRFMGRTRLRFSFPVDRSEQAVGALNRRTIRGAPVLDDQGRVISVLFAAPTNGGLPLGATAKEIQDAVDTTVALPESFTAAAVLAIGRRSVIPVIVGAVLGLVWGMLSRNGTTVFKTVGLALAGVVAAALYSAFTVMVIGPQMLLG